MKVENTDHTKNMLVNDGRTVPQMKSSGSHNSQIIIHKHYHSDCCLLQPFYVHSRIISKCSHIHYHFYYQYPKSTCKESLFNSEEKDLNKISNQVSNLNLLSPSNHSLSTGNICCLYALKCVPSIECVASQLSSPCQQQQEIFSENKRSSPTITSIMMNRRNNARLISPFEKLKYHPCYQDRERHLGKWIQEILTHTGDSDENDDGDDNSDENPDGGNQNNSKVTKNKAVDNTNTNNFSRNRMYSSLKHVRFADESACSSSVTTLNSLSRSSSFSSLNISNTSLSGVSCSHISNLCPDSDWAISDRLLSQSSISKEFLFSNLRPKQLIKRTTNNRNNTYNDHGNNSENASDRRQHIKNNHTETPLVTVNLFHNTSEPPEVPQHVLNQLESIKKWKPQFTNPINCTYFIQRLLEQKVCLCHCWSNNFHSIHVQVKTIASSQGYPDFSAEVRLRYTLDHWQTYTECSPLTKLDHLTESHNDFQSIETYESEVKLHFVLINETSLFSTEFRSYQLEFAVVYRGSGYEYWIITIRKITFVVYDGCCKMHIFRFLFYCDY
ncbi:unnamed protein product [Heterobilharzia americana]|nr:unnamed protein product [Heterobilharzia americana]